MASELQIVIDERTLRQLVLQELRVMLGAVELAETDVMIEVKSKQNWKAEWEVAAFRAVVRKSL